MWCVVCLNPEQLALSQRRSSLYCLCTLRKGSRREAGEAIRGLSVKIFVLGLDEGRLLPLLVPRFNAKADGDGLPLRVFVVWRRRCVSWMQLLISRLTVPGPVLCALRVRVMPRDACW